jgi:hypothetical protein
MEERMKREDFVFTIGYQGNAALIDGEARRKYGKYSAAELLEEGLYRAAFCAALYDESLQEFTEDFRNRTGNSVDNETALKRLFGVFEVPDNVEKTIVAG